MSIWIHQFLISGLLHSQNYSCCWMRMLVFHSSQFIFHLSNSLIVSEFIKTLIKTFIDECPIIGFCLVYTLIFHLFGFLLFSLKDWNPISLLQQNLIAILIIFVFDLDVIVSKLSAKQYFWLKNHFYFFVYCHFCKSQPLRIFLIKDSQANRDISLFSLDTRKYLVELNHSLSIFY